MATSKIDAFAYLLGDLSDEKIAEMADVKPSTVATYRRKLAAKTVESGDESDIADAAPGEGELEASDSEPVEGAEADQVDDADVERVFKSAPEPEPEAPVSPKTVRVKHSQVIKDPANRTWRLGRRDVYSGEQARFLWMNHRDLVEVYPPKD